MVLVISGLELVHFGLDFDGDNVSCILAMGAPSRHVAIR